MSDTEPIPITIREWQEIVKVPAIRDGWGLEEGADPREFAARVYAAKFKFRSGSPGYVGDIYILQGDALTEEGPLVLRRGTDGRLTAST